MWHIWRKGKLHEVLRWGNLNEIDLFEDGMSIKIDHKESGRAVVGSSG
jgi:hypothetical protein